MYLNIFKRFARLFALPALLMVSLPVAAAEEETIKMEGMSVIGNKESPNLLYIVRWKSPKLPDMEGPLVLSRIVDEALKPVDREVLIREELYREARQQIYNK